MGFNGKTHATHRVSAYIFLGLGLYSRLKSLHRCDMKDCWEPTHLYIGTQKDNVRDAIEKGTMTGREFFIFNGRI